MNIQTVTLEPTVRRCGMIGFDAHSPGGPHSPFLIRKVGQRAEVTVLRNEMSLTFDLEDTMDIKRMNERTQELLKRTIPDDLNHALVAESVEALAIGAQYLQRSADEMQSRIERARTFWNEVRKHGEDVGSIAEHYGTPMVFLLANIQSDLLGHAEQIDVAPSERDIFKLIDRLPSATRWRQILRHA